MALDAGEKQDHPILTKAIEELRERFREFREGRRFGSITVNVPFQGGNPGDPDSTAVIKKRF